MEKPSSRRTGQIGLLSYLFGNQRGSISIIAAAAMPVLLGFGGLAVDASLWMRAKHGVQGAADAAASSVAAAAVKSGAAGACTGSLQAEATGVAAADGYQNGANSVVVTCNHPPSSGSYTTDPNAYEVIVSAPQQLYLGSVIPRISAPTVQARAVAKIASHPACIIALDPSATPNVHGIVGAGIGGLNASGSGTLTSQNCAIDVNASNSASVSLVE